MEFDGSSFYSGDGGYDFNLNTSNETNVTSCEILRYESEPLPISPTVAEVIRWVQYVFYMVSFILGVSLNVLVIVLVAKFKKLQSLKYYFMLHVIISDLMGLLFIFFSATVGSFANRWVLGAGSCSLFGFLGLLLFQIRNYVLFVLTTDRFLNVFYSLRYPRHQVKVVAVLFIAMWVVSITLSLIPLPGLLDCFEYDNTIRLCTLGLGCKKREACSNYTTVVLVFVGNLILFIAFGMYIVLYIKARKVQSQVQPKLSCVGYTPEEICIRRRSSKRATITLLLLFLSLFGIAFPSFFVRTIIPSIFQGIDKQELYIVISIFVRILIFTVGMIDPVILLRNGDVREITSGLMKQLKVKVKGLSNNV